MRRFVLHDGAAGRAQSTSRTEAVLFDWGDTLARFSGVLSDREGHVRGVRAALEETAAEEGGPLGDLDPDAFCEAYVRAALELIERSNRTMREHCLEERVVMAFQTSPGAAPGRRSVRLLTDKLCRAIADSSRPVSGAEEVLSALAGRVRLAVVSNYPSARTVRLSLERMGFARYLDSIIVSESVGWLKPDSRPFTAALEELAVHPRNAWFVGNDLGTDIDGARAVGCRTAWLAGPGGAGRDGCADLHLAALGDLAGAMDIP